MLGVGVMLDLNAFAKEVHAVSVAHGWWEKDDPDNNHDTKIALIHAEWSEALEEYRAGRPMVWCRAKALVEGELVCSKPEGIAVELIDGVLRIVDLCEGIGVEVEDWEILRQGCEARQEMFEKFGEIRIGMLISVLHKLVADVFGKKTFNKALEAAILALAWVEHQGTDPWELLCLKHEYNKTRPYKHGNKRC
jgi:hypothetical protein